MAMTSFASVFHRLPMSSFIWKFSCFSKWLSKFTLFSDISADEMLFQSANGKWKKKQNKKTDSQISTSNRNAKKQPSRRKKTMQSRFDKKQRNINNVRLWSAAAAVAVAADLAEWKKNELNRWFYCLYAYISYVDTTITPTSAFWIHKKICFSIATTCFPTSFFLRLIFLSVLVVVIFFSRI